MLAGQNGILTRAAEAKDITGIPQEEELIRLAVQESLVKGNGIISLEDLNTALSNNLGIDVNMTGDSPWTYDGDNNKYKITSSGGVEIVSDVEENNIIKDDTSLKSAGLEKGYVGYYADTNGDGSIDGVIYADLAVSVSGSWINASEDFSYEAEDPSNFKEYYITEKKIISVRSEEGETIDRFYIMSLSDIDGKQNGTEYYWYNSFSLYSSSTSFTVGNRKGMGENPGNPGVVSSPVLSSDFGYGKKNTETMITAWNAKQYGAQNSKDVWGAVQTKFNDGWFIPSCGEWSAYGSNLGITYESYGRFSDRYWSSSLFSCDISDCEADCTYLGDDDRFWGMITQAPSESAYVRLSRTF